MPGGNMPSRPPLARIPLNSVPATSERSLQMYPRPILLRTSCLWLLIFSCAQFTVGEDIGDDKSLHRQIDALVDTARVGPPTAICSDPEFMHRAYLDLTGKIPSTKEAREFLADEAPNKRERLIKRLLKDPHFNRNFMRVLDVMLMERMPEKVVKPDTFRTFIRQSLEKEKGLDQLIREILVADGAKNEQRASARFLLDRAAEPHAMTRDIGRILLGINMECAQCHDHPSIDDYHQADYYGLYAFLNRSYLFGNSEKGAVVAEKGEGEASFFSVFVGDDPKEMKPHLPGGAHLNDPELAQSDLYHVKPEEGVRPIPKFSRRSQLAEELTSGRYSAFQKNLANRIWAHMLGRGIVHPLDLHHSANPPVHPELLDLLGETLVAFDFNLRQFVQEIALSQTYQRSSQIPHQLIEYAHHADTDRKEAQQHQQQQKRVVEKAETEQKKLRNEKSELEQEIAILVARRSELQTKAADVRVRTKSLKSERSGYEGLLSSLQEATEELQTVLQQATGLSDLEPENLSLKEVATKTKQRATLLAQEQKQSTGRLEQINEQLQAMAEAEKAAADELLAIERAHPALKEKEQKLAAQVQGHQRRFDVSQKRLIAMDARLEDFAALSRYVESVGQGSNDDGSETEALQQLAERWRERFNCAHVLPLTAEQLSWSITEAVGVVDRYREELMQAAAKEAADPDNEDPESSDKAKLAQNQQVEQSLYTKVEQSLYDFIVNVHDKRGQPDGTFQATAREALFMSRSNRVLGWISGGSQNLAERLMKTSGPQEIADELYLAVLSRYPDEEETSIVNVYLEKSPEEKKSALHDLVWALVSCAEFRFQH